MKYPTALPRSDAAVRSTPRRKTLKWPCDALARSARGASGKLRVKTVLPGQIDDALQALVNFTQITLTPFAAKRGGRVGLYYIGNWPAEHGARGPGKAPAERYANPRGFI